MTQVAPPHFAFIEEFAVQIDICPAVAACKLNIFYTSKNGVISEVSYMRVELAEGLNMDCEWELKVGDGGGEALGRGAD